MVEKKSEVLTIRIPESTKKALEQAAEEKEWTTSKLAEKILTSWANQEKKKELNINFTQNQINNIHIQ